MPKREEIRSSGLSLVDVLAEANARGLSGAELVATPIEEVRAWFGDAAGVEEVHPDDHAEPEEIRASVIAMARDDFATFAEYVLRDEETGGRIELRPMHEQMCRAVMDSDHLVVMAHPESGKTNLLVVAAALFLLGRNPNLRIALVSNTRDAAKKNLTAIVGYIERSAALRDVFPDLRPGEGATWSTETITVARPNVMRDPSIQTLGVHGSIQGSRVDVVLGDDLLDYENTRTKALREDTSRWFRSAVLARANRVVFCTNAWHPEDLSVELVRERGFRELRFPIYDARGESSWPERWPRERIEARREKIGELEFTRLFRCRPRDDGAQVFTPESIERCKQRGRGYGLVTWLDDADVPPDALVVTGVDLAVTRRMKGAVTAMYTVFVHPNGLRQIIGARSGRWGARQILTNLADVGETYGGVIVVEDNGAQRYLVEIAQELDTMIPVPVLMHTTGRNKIDPELGVDSMAAEFDAGRWIIPSRRGQLDAELQHFVNELDVYDPASHPGDRLMAVWFARAYAMRVMARRRRQRRDGASGGDVRISTYG